MTTSEARSRADRFRRGGSGVLNFLVGLFSYSLVWLLFLAIAVVADGG